MRLRLFVAIFQDHATGHYDLHAETVEAENDLSSLVTFGERGIFRCGDLNHVVDKAQCRPPAMNAIVAVNTVLLEAVVGRLKSRGIKVPEEVPAHVSPRMRRHINPYGRYRFEAPQTEPAP